jgi:predicted nucleic acid-binding protein
LSAVFDASVSLARCFPAQSTARTESLLSSLSEDDGHVSCIWPLEVANVLLMAERRGRYSAAEVAGILDRLRALPLVVDEVDVHQTFEIIVGLAREHKLTVHDASYLELAVRLGLPLASNDADLRAAAASIGVEVL